MRINEHESAFDQQGAYLNAGGSKKAERKAKRKAQKLAAAKADPTGRLMEAYNLEYGSKKDKQKAAGNLALNLLFPFAGVFKKAKKKREDKKRRKKQAEESRSIELSDSGERI